jgi:hypothetical protein
MEGALESARLASRSCGGDPHGAAKGVEGTIKEKSQMQDWGVRQLESAEKEMAIPADKTSAAKVAQEDIIGSK